MSTHFASMFSHSMEEFQSNARRFNDSTAKCEDVFRDFFKNEIFIFTNKEYLITKFCQAKIRSDARRFNSSTVKCEDAFGAFFKHEIFIFTDKEYLIKKFCQETFRS